MTKRLPLSPLARRIFASADAHRRANPHWGWTESDYLADDIKKLREEIAASGGASMTNDEGKPPVVHLVAADLAVGSPMASEPAPRKRAPRRPSIAAEIKSVADTGLTVTGVTIEPDGRRTMHFGGSTDDSEAQDARVVAFRRIAKLREGNG